MVYILKLLGCYKLKTVTYRGLKFKLILLLCDGSAACFELFELQLYFCFSIDVQFLFLVQDWEKVEAELRNFGDKYSQRRNLEADLLKNDDGSNCGVVPTTTTIPTTPAGK